MNSTELQRAYGDSQTLDRPQDGETVHPYVDDSDSESVHPLDRPGTVENAHSQAWGH